MWQAVPQESLTEYQKETRANIARNKVKLAELGLANAAAALVADERGRKRGRQGAAEAVETTAPMSASNTTDKELPPYEEEHASEDELMPAAVAQAMHPKPSATASSRRHGAEGTGSGVHARKGRGGQQSSGATAVGRVSTRGGCRQQGGTAQATPCM